VGVVGVEPTIPSVSVVCGVARFDAQLDRPPQAARSLFARTVTADEYGATYALYATSTEVD
jgi:hypothetical protein